MRFRVRLPGPFSVSFGGRRRRRRTKHQPFWTHPGCTIHHRSPDAANRCKVGRPVPPPTAVVARPDPRVAAAERRATAAERRAQAAETSARDAERRLRLAEARQRIAERRRQATPRPKPTTVDASSPPSSWRCEYCDTRLDSGQLACTACGKTWAESQTARYLRDD